LGDGGGHAPTVALLCYASERRSAVRIDGHR
jgi:hypothetical protein